MKRVNKREARKIWNDGGSISFVACKMNPNSPWAAPFFTSKYELGGREFDKVVYEFEYYNCCNSETGRYAAFYVEE